jgi:hypothetical protein
LEKGASNFNSMNEDKENSKNKEGSENFGLPEGYFQKSTQSIFNKIEWQEEHKNCPSLLSLKGKTGFIVPENYFIKSEVKLELIEYKELSAAKEGKGFVVPENYFRNNLLILQKMLVGEANELQTVDRLSSIQKRNNFSVETDYFSKSESRLKTLLTEGNKPARVISLFTRRVIYSAAAVLIIALGLWIYNFYFIPVAVKDCGTIACVDKQDLVKMKNLENLDNDELYELVDPQKLEKKLEKQKTNDKNKKGTDSSLKQLSTEDLLDEI